MYKTIARTLLGAGAAAALALGLAATAAADTDSIVSWGDSNLGGSLGYNGGSASFGGITTTIDGINTFDGSLTVSGYGVTSKVQQHYTLGSTETEWDLTSGGSTSHVEGYLYYDPSRWGALDIDANGGSVSIVCDPLCHEQ